MGGLCECLQSLLCIAGGNGLCGGGRLEGPSNLLVHTEVCQRESPPTIPGAHHPLRQGLGEGIGGVGVEVGERVPTPGPS